MVANARQPLFGKLAHNGAEAVIEKTAIGWALINQQRRLLELCPEVKILADKVMPDHHHMVLQVQRTMPRSIRQVVRGYMQGCKEEARKLGFVENLYDGPPFYRVLTHKGQLHAMIELPAEDEFPCLFLWRFAFFCLLLQANGANTL